MLNNWIDSTCHHDRKETLSSLRIIETQSLKNDVSDVKARGIKEMCVILFSDTPGCRAKDVSSTISKHI